VKRTGILNAELSAAVASMGHGDALAIVDAGMSIPESVRRIDLAVSEDLPGWLDVIESVVRELLVERYKIASELAAADDSHQSSLADLLGGVAVETVSHSELQKELNTCRAVVRTGEFSSYANTILYAGVVF